MTVRESSVSHTEKAAVFWGFFCFVLFVGPESLTVPVCMLNVSSFSQRAANCCRFPIDPLFPDYPVSWWEACLDEQTVTETIAGMRSCISNMCRSFSVFGLVSHVVTIWEFILSSLMFPNSLNWIQGVSEWCVCTCVYVGVS